MGDNPDAKARRLAAKVALGLDREPKPGHWKSGSSKTPPQSRRTANTRGQQGQPKKGGR